MKKEEKKHSDALNYTNINVYLNVAVALYVR